MDIPLIFLVSRKVHMYLVFFIPNLLRDKM